MSETVDEWKAGADRYTHYYGDVRRLLASEYAAEVRWITASLFALNAGGLLSLAGKDKLSATQQDAGFSFWLGVLLAFCYVIYSQAKTKKFLLIIQHLENAWVVCAATGRLNEALVAELENVKSQVNSKWAIYLAASSFLSFSLGIGLAAHGK